MDSLKSIINSEAGNFLREQAKTLKNTVGVEKLANLMASSSLNVASKARQVVESAQVPKWAIAVEVLSLPIILTFISFYLLSIFFLWKNGADDEKTRRFIETNRLASSMTLFVAAMVVVYGVSSSIRPALTGARFIVSAN